jgi:hypothetical protein
MYQVKGLRSHPESYRGKTAIWDAVLGSIKMFDQARSGDVIYVITDGGDNASKTSLDQVIQTLGESGIRLSGVAFRVPSALLRNEEQARGLPILDRVARETGGTILSQFPPLVGSMPVSGAAPLIDKVGKRTTFALALDSQYLQLTSFYRVSFELPEALHKPQGWKLELAGIDESQRKKTTLTYPRVLGTCR